MPTNTAFPEYSLYLLVNETEEAITLKRVTANDCNGGLAFISLNLPKFEEFKKNTIKQIIIV